MEMPQDLEPPQWGQFGQDLHKRSYARFMEDGNKEGWADTILRTVNGNCNFVAGKHIERSEREALFELLYNFKMLPGGRHLWVTGVPDRQYVSNCWTAGYDSIFSRHFCFMFSRLMEGGGVGSNYSDRFFSRYPKIHSEVDLHIVCDKEHQDYDVLDPLLSDAYSPKWSGCHSVADSREGWVEALQILIDSYFDKIDEPVILDVSQVRPSGKRLKSFGGTSSGPFALVDMLSCINKMVNAQKGNKPDYLLALKLDHEIARCVIAGNIRRSARISVKHWQDDSIMEFIALKESGKVHWSTNISVMVDSNFWKMLRRRDSKAKKVMKAMAEGMHRNGEPGICNATFHQRGELFPFFATNPCGEVSLPEWGSCLLGSVNLVKFVDDEDGMMKAFRLMARFLIRATYADYPDEIAREIVERDRRIGVGFFGFHHWLLREGDTYTGFPHNERLKEVLIKAKKVVRKAAREYAFQLRIPEPVKVTTAAPTGSTAKLCDSSEGIQPIFFKYFKRRIMFGMSDESNRALVESYRARGYEVEKIEGQANTECVVFYCKDPLIGKVDEDLVEASEDITIEDFMEVQATLQEIYVDNSISATVNFDSEDITPKIIEEILRSYGPRLKGTTLMPFVSNISQMPYERITKEEYEKALHKHESVQQMECKGNVCQMTQKTEQDMEYEEDKKNGNNKGGSKV